MKNIVFYLMAVAMLPLAACDDIYLNMNVTRVTGVSLEHDVVFIAPGQSIDLTATITPANATEKTLNWYSSNPNVVSVDNNGRITGIRLVDGPFGNNSTIRVATKEGRFTDELEVRVVAAIP